MARKSSIDRLPPEVRDLIGSLRENGRTIDEILEKLRELDVTVSRSALGRYTQQIDDLAEVLREGRVVSQAVMERIEDAPESRVARMNVELMHGIASKLLLGSAKEIGPKEAAFLAKALKDLATASKADLDREIRLRRDLRAEVEKRIEKVAREAGSPPGVDANTTALGDVLRRIREEVYGVFEE